MKRTCLVLIISISICLWSVGAYTDQAYRLGASDVIRVTVYGHPDLSTVSRVAENGSFTFPAIGQVSLGGLSTREAEIRLANILTKMDVVKAPEVGIVVEQYQSKRVAVLGQVAQPGVYAITRGSTVMDLISEAGGLADDAGDVAVVTHESGVKGEKMVVDLTSHLEGRSDQSEPKVRDGDRIYVPRMERFYVYGQVNRPGAYRFERGMSVMQALSVAGGLTGRGTERGMKIRRKTNSGGQKIMPADLTHRIEPGDVVHIKESFF